MRIEGRLDALPQDDRRTTARRELRLRVASLAGESAAANVVVLDLSQTGLLLETSARMATGESLQIDLPHAGLQTAEVVWTSGAYVGCRFARPIGAAAVSADQLRSEPAAAAGAVSRAAIGEGSAADDSFGARLRRLRKQYNLSQSAPGHGRGSGPAVRGRRGRLAAVARPGFHSEPRIRARKA